MSDSKKRFAHEMILEEICQCGELLHKNSRELGYGVYTIRINGMLNFLEQMKISKEHARETADKLAEFKAKNYFSFKQEEKVDNLIIEFRAL